MVLSSWPLSVCVWTKCCRQLEDRIKQAIEVLNVHDSSTYRTDGGDHFGAPCCKMYVLFWDVNTGVAKNISVPQHLREKFTASLLYLYHVRRLQWHVIFVNWLTGLSTFLTSLCKNRPCSEQNCKKQVEKKFTVCGLGVQSGPVKLVACHPTPSLRSCQLSAVLLCIFNMYRSLRWDIKQL